MVITVKRLDVLSVVSLSGSIDALTSEKVTESLDEQFARGEKNIVLDLSGVDFMSSAGLRVLLGALKEARRKGGDLCLAGAQERVAKFLKLSGFVNLLKEYATADEAVEQFKS